MQEPRCLQDAETCWLLRDLLCCSKYIRNVLTRITMSSFGTSVINKSGKKLAPKAPARRKPPVSAPSNSASAANSRLSTAEPELAEPPNKRQRVDAPLDVSEQHSAQSRRAPLPTPPSTQDATPTESIVTLVDGPAQPGVTSRRGDLIVTESQVERTQEAPPASALDNTEQSASTAVDPKAAAPEPATRAASRRSALRKPVAKTVNVATRTQVSRGEAISSQLDAPTPIAESSHASPLQTFETTNGSKTPRQPPTSSQQKSTRSRKGKEKETQANANAVADNSEVAIPSSSRAAATTRGSKAREHIEPEAASAASPLDTRATTRNRDQDTTHTVARTKRGRGRKSKAVSDEIVRDDDGGDEAIPASTNEDARETAQPEASSETPGATRKTRKPRTKKASPKEGSRNEPSPHEAEHSVEGQTEGAIEGSGSPSGSKKRRRAPTPEDAEAHEIDVSTTTMVALTRDSRKGKKSKLEAAMQDIDWADVKRRKEEAEQRAYELGQLERSEQEVNARLDKAGEQDAPSNAPRTKIVNGQIVIDTSSLVVDRHAVAAADAANQPIEELEEDDITAHVTSHSWVHDSRRDPEERRVMKMKSDPWNEAQTNEFYKALSMFGTDFFIISKMFPGKTRRQIKLKFVREERANPVRINSALLGDESLPMDINAYATATGREESYYKDPDVLKQELRDEEQRQKEEIEKQREEQEQAQREKQRKAAGKNAAAQKERAAKRAGNSKKKGRGAPGPGAAGVEVGVEPAPGT